MLNHFTFWIVNPKDFVSERRFIKCTIDSQSITIFSDPVRQIEIRKVAEFKLGTFSYSPSSFDVTLVVVGETESLSIIPIDPLNPNRIGDLSEAEALVKVIQTVKTDVPISLNANPFFRRMARLKHKPKAGEVWDANVSPLFYYRERIEPTVIKLFLLAGLLVIATLLLGLLIGFFR